MEGPGLSAPFVVFVLTVKAIETVVIKDPVFVHRALGGKVFDGNFEVTEMERKNKVEKGEGEKKEKEESLGVRDLFGRDLRVITFVMFLGWPIGG